MISALIWILIFCAYSAVAYNYDGEAYKKPHYAGNRTTMVHLFEWKFKDVARECELFLGPAGYAGVQVSPIHENVVLPKRPWYERYQVVSYKMVTRSGDENDFKDMVSRCNAVGVRVYVDIIINHTTRGDLGRVTGSGGSSADTANFLYPAVPYAREDFNEPCVIKVKDYSDPVKMRNCKLFGLLDLNLAREHVREKIVDFLNRAIDFGVAGFRVDAVKHMWPEDLEVIYSRLHDLKSEVFGPNKRPFIYQEVISFDRDEPLNKWQYVHLAAITEFVYGNILGRCFRGWEPLKSLEHWLENDRRLLDSRDVLVFVDNHDNQRDGHGKPDHVILTHRDARLYKMAVAFMLAYPYGHPRVMSSFAFDDPNQGPPTSDDDSGEGRGAILSPEPANKRAMEVGADINMCGNGWVCEHRWRQIYQMAGFKNVVGDSAVSNWWSNGHNQIAFSRGNLGFIAFNGEYGVDLKEHLQTGMAMGEYCDIISGKKVRGNCSGKRVKVEADGTAYIEIFKDESNGVLAIHAESKL
ncbi:alpha-amylase 1-like [Trichogramma pretiosum]|uniref:alpha-amylase 1-like n=1 Tax=Trichogramma pretiosum TaxID=7493 RepID=UPI000C71A5C4|nr:alpha-amylase 1-like [Trichogramma pretiosum]